MKAGVNNDNKVVFIEAEEKKIELSYIVAIRVMAQWWEGIKGDGINVAAELQKEREKLASND